jgi:hypothetical protein
MAAWLLLLVPAPLAAQPQEGTAQDATETYRQVFKPVSEIDCPRGAEDEIVVCARPSWKPDPNRPPLPYPPVPGERTRLVPGEAPRATLNADACMAYQRCGNGGFSISVNILALPGLVKKVIERVEDETE